MRLLKGFCNDESGESLIEYTLLVAFIALSSALMCTSASGGTKGVWSATNNQLSAANAFASSCRGCAVTGSLPESPTRFNGR